MSNWFHICHSYWKMAREGRAPKITCGDCHSALYITWSPMDDNPRFGCIQCNTKITPGLGILSEIKAAVEANLGRKL